MGNVILDNLQRNAIEKEELIKEMFHLNDQNSDPKEEINSMSLTEQMALFKTVAVMATTAKIIKENAMGVDACSKIAYEEHRKIREYIIDAYGDTPENLLAKDNKNEFDI